MTSNISDEGDENCDGGSGQTQKNEHEEIKDSESSVGTPQSSPNNRVHTPPPVFPKVHVTPNKQHRNMKDNRVEEKLLQICEKPEPKHDEDEMVCLSLTVTPEKITHTQKKELSKVQL